MFDFIENGYISEIINKITKILYLVDVEPYQLQYKPTENKIYFFTTIKGKDKLKLCGLFRSHYIYNSDACFYFYNFELIGDEKMCSFSFRISKQYIKNLNRIYNNFHYRVGFI